jgi:CRISPR/Cas system CSM-associated protein Csm3 (group 7 of RAMP superfamily)
MCRDQDDSCPACAIFGSPWIPGRLRFVSLELTGPPELVEALELIRRDKGTPATTWRYGVALSRHRRVAEDALLFTTELFEPGVPLTFGGTLTGPLGERDAAWVCAGLRLLPALGRAKSAGLGRLSSKAAVRLDGEPLDDTQLRAALEEVGP